MQPITIPPPADLHTLSRFSWGITPELLADSAAAGGAGAWFESQLHPLGLTDGFASKMRNWYPHLSLSPAELVAQERAGQIASTEVGQELCQWSLMRRTYSKRQLLEVMVSLWSDHFHITTPGGIAWPFRVAHDAAIRAHALGRFEDLLLAVDLGPAMLCYLDGAVSTAARLNENLGRELLELHTVGREQGGSPIYSEDDVLDAARVLTGYRVDRGRSWNVSYEPSAHWTGGVRVLDWRRVNTQSDGRAVAVNLLRYLARHPATAHRIALKLCTRLVADVPSESIVAAVADAYIASGSEIKTMLRTLVSHPDFLPSAGKKERSPVEDAVATWRALGMRALRPRIQTDFAITCLNLVGALGYRPFSWPRPDGPPDVGFAWSSVGRMLGSFHFHAVAAQGNSGAGVTYRNLASWLPRFPSTVRQLVTHVSTQLLGRKPNNDMLQSASLRLELPLDRRLATYEEFKSYRLERLLACLLDTPTHMSR